MARANLVLILVLKIGGTLTKNDHVNTSKYAHIQSVVPPRPERTGTKSRNQIGSTRRKASAVDEEVKPGLMMKRIYSWSDLGETGG